MPCHKAAVNSMDDTVVVQPCSSSALPSGTSELSLARYLQLAPLFLFHIENSDIGQGAAVRSRAAGTGTGRLGLGSFPRPPSLKVVEPPPCLMPNLVYRIFLSGGISFVIYSYQPGSTEKEGYPSCGATFTFPSIPVITRGTDPKVHYRSPNTPWADLQAWDTGGLSGSSLQYLSPFSRLPVCKPR